MIEELLDTPMTVVESSKLGKVSRINDARVATSNSAKAACRPVPAFPG
jgi:hypothetical protein